MVKEHISYKMPYLLRLLQCCPLVSDIYIVKINAYRTILKKVKK